ncbi:MAG TPA: carboxypeptidase regulatory-like domain-containing protein [Symbiobacteriaceae bacterium]|nr:carboxypeptidase regulatory-like domain-containing protein [Symbiobacteriaceae bacterium]
MRHPVRPVYRLAIAALAILLACGSLLTLSPTPVHGADPETGVNLADLSALKAGSRKSEHPKLESGLQDLAVQLPEALGASTNPPVPAKADEHESRPVQVIVTVQPGTEDQVEQKILKLGGTVQLRLNNQLQAVMPRETAAAVSDLPQVMFVGRPERYYAMDVVGEGVAVTHSDQWHRQGAGGQGVKVGILDLGFYGYEAAMGTELPLNTVARSFRLTPTNNTDITGDGDPHGTAVAEIIHDMAPEAELYLANFYSTLEMSQAVDWLIAEGVDVINASIGIYLGGPGDGTGMAADIVRRARNAGILWVNSAGNWGEDHWSGRFSDSDGDGFHNFSGTDETNSIFLFAGDYLGIDLKWNDWTKQNQDYDLLLTDDYDRLVALSINYQSGSQPPVEALDYVAPSDGWYHIRIGRDMATRSVDFDLIINTSPAMKAHPQALPSEPWQLEYQNASRSIAIPGDSRDALTVGATNWGDDTLAEYSSRGPTLDGRIKPDITAPTGVISATYGGEFHGTSSSAPHVAGAAALLKSAHPTWGPAELSAYLQKYARDLGKSGKDNDYGSGRLEMAVGSVAGTITGLESAPLANADVRAEGGGYTWQTATDDAGHFLIPGVPPGTYSVTAVAAEYRQQSKTGVRVAVGQQPIVNMTLASTLGSLTGRITDSRNLPLEGAAVRATKGTTVLETQTDATGSYAFTRMAEGSYALRVTLDDYKPVTKSSVKVTSGRTTSADLKLTSLYGTIGGKVTAAAGNQPLSGATVTLSNSSGTVATATTGGDGTYSFTRVAEGTYTVTATLADFKPLSQKNVRVSGGGAATVSMKLSTILGTVAGKVTDARRQPIVGARVQVTGTGGSWEALTDAAGAYSILRVTEGTFTVTVSKDDYRLPAPKSIKVTGGKTTSFHQQLTPLYSTISGTVTNAAGQALAGAEVEVKNQTTQAVVATATTGANGAYSIPRLLDGTYTVTVTMDEYNEQVKTKVKLSGGQVMTMNWKLISVYGTLTGKVTNSSRRAIAGATVTVTDAGGTSVGSAVSGADGRYAVQRLPAGSYSVIFSQAGYTTKTYTRIQISSGSTRSLNTTLSRSSD